MVRVMLSVDVVEGLVEVGHPRHKALNDWFTAQQSTLDFSVTCTTLEYMKMSVEVYGKSSHQTAYQAIRLTCQLSGAVHPIIHGVASTYSKLLEACETNSIATPETLLLLDLAAATEWGCILLARADHELKQLKSAMGPNIATIYDPWTATHLT